MINWLKLKPGDMIVRIDGLKSALLILGVERKAARLPDSDDHLTKITAYHVWGPHFERIIPLLVCMYDVKDPNWMLISHGDE